MNASPHESLKPVAREVLGVDENATPEACRQAFLWRLADEQLLPGAVLLDAATVLGIIPGSGDNLPSLTAYHERQLNEQIEQFAGDYWDLTPEVREQTWRALDRLTDETPRARERLATLKTGLSLSLPADERGMFLPLIQCCERVYVAPEARRARVMRAILAEHRLQPVELRLMANNFLGEHPGFGRLFEQLQLTDAATRIRRSTEAEDEKREKRKPAATTQTWGGGKGQTHRGWPAYLLIFLVIGVVRVLLLGTGGKSSSTVDPPRSGTIQIDRDRLMNPQGKFPPFNPPGPAVEPNRGLIVPVPARPNPNPAFPPQGPPFPGNPR